MPKGPGAKKPTQMGASQDLEIGEHPKDASITQDDSHAEDFLRLQRQMTGLQETLRRQEARWTAEHRRLRHRIQELSMGDPQLEPRARKAHSARRAPRMLEVVLGDPFPPADSAEVTPKCSGSWSRGTAVQGTGPANEGTQAWHLQTPRGRSTPVPGAGSLSCEVDSSACTCHISSPRSRLESPVSGGHSGEPQVHSLRDSHNSHPDGQQAQSLPSRQRALPPGRPRSAQEVPQKPVLRLVDGVEETVFPDGTVLRVDWNGDRTILFSDGQKEVHTAQFWRREHTDGTVRTVYSDGRRETRCPCGRVMVRDPAGRRLPDTYT